MAKSKYHPFWSAHRKIIVAILERVAESEKEVMIHFPEIMHFGRRKSWSGTIVLSEGKVISGGEMAHIKALGKLIATDTKLLQGKIFRLSMNNEGALKIKLVVSQKDRKSESNESGRWGGLAKDLLEPKKLWSRSEVLSSPSPVPDKPGIYAWYFKEIPPQVPFTGCHVWQDLTLLYVGISPKEKNSERNLKARIKEHYKGNAYGSILRKTLGCLLRDQLGISLRFVGTSGKRIHFAEGEDVLSKWMDENAFVTWVFCDEPWMFENDLIRELDLPLNSIGNKDHPFYQTLVNIRKACKQSAEKNQYQ